MGKSKEKRSKQLQFLIKTHNYRHLSNFKKKNKYIFLIDTYRKSNPNKLFNFVKQIRIKLLLNSKTVKEYIVSNRKMKEKKGIQAQF